MAENLEIEEQQVVSQVDGDGGKKEKLPKVAPSVQLYNDILSLKEPGFSDEYKKIGYKKFNSLLTGDEEFQNALLTDLNERGFGISPEQFAGTYLPAKGPAEVYDLDKVEKVQEEPVLEKEDGGIFDQIKGMAKSVYNYGKDYYKAAKRGVFTGLGQQDAQVEDFLRGDVDTQNLAKYLKKANEVGSLMSEAEYAKDESFAKDAGDLALVIGPAIVESFASMGAAGYKKMAGIIAAGTAGGAAIGGAPGALVGGTRAAQVAMVQQGYNLEFVSSVIDDLTEKGAINPNADEATLKKQLDSAFANKDLMKPIYEKAHTRAGIIMGVDVAASGIGGRVVGVLRKAAMSKPVARTSAGKLLQKAAVKIGETAPLQAAARLTNRATDVANKFAKSKVGRAVDVVDATDITAGAGGEALAQYETEGKIDWKEVAVEGFAEGGYIKALRALADIGNKKQQLKGLPAYKEPGKLPSPEEEDEFVAVTQEEFDNYKKGNISPERAAGIKDDVDIAFKDPSHIEKLKAGDALYSEMVKDAFDKHIAALENQKLYNIAVGDIAELNGITEEEVKAAIKPNSESFNQKIADDFKNSYNVLQQQYKEKVKNDSQNAAGVSGEGGVGQESQQAQSQQGASEEEVGNGRVFQKALAEDRIAEIDDMLLDDSNYLQESGMNLLTDEERADFLNEKQSLLDEIAAQEQGQNVATGNVQPQTNIPPTGGMPPQPAPTEVVGGVAPTAAPAGAVAQQAAATPTAGLGKAVPKEKGVAAGVTKPAKPVAAPTAAKPKSTTKVQAAAKAEPKTEEKPAAKEIKPADVEIRKGKTHDKDGVYEAVYKGKVIGKMFFDKKEKVWVDAAGDKFAQKKDAVNKFVLRYNMVETNKPSTKPAKAETKTEEKPKAQTEKKSETKAEPKKETKPQIAKKDVSVRKGKDFATEGVYEVMANGEVIGRMYYDKSLYNAWVDADVEPSTPSTFKGVLGTKPDAMEVFINRYNATGAAKPATTKKAEPKAKAEEVKKEVKTQFVNKTQEEYVAEKVQEYKDGVKDFNSLKKETKNKLVQNAEEKAIAEYQKQREVALKANTLPAEFKNTIELTAEEKVAKDKARYEKAGYPQNHNEALTRKEHKDEVSDAIKNGYYEDAIAKGTITKERAVEIVKSAGLPIPESLSATTKGKPKTETKSEGISANDVKSLTKVNEELFGLDKEKASVAASVMDAMIAQMANRAGITKEEMYAKLEFRKATAKGLPKGVKLQLDAWHGSPYQFAKFLLENIDTGEGAQAFGWGLYFTDLKDVAEWYANELGGVKDNISLEEIQSILPASPNVESLAINLERNIRIRGVREGLQKFKENTELLGVEFYTPEELNFVKNLQEKDLPAKFVYKVNLFKNKKRYVVAPIQSLDQKWNVYDSRTWEQVHKNPYPLSSVEATTKALQDSFDDGEKFLVLKHITGALRSNLSDLEYLVESEKDLNIAKKIQPLQTSITEEMELINETGKKSEINFKQELKKFKSKFDEIRELFDSLEENSPSINQMKEAFSEVSEDGVNAWITANSKHKAKKYHEAKAKGDNAPIIREVEKTVGTGTQGMLDDLFRVTPEKRFNSKEEALSWINDNNEYTFLEWDKQVSDSIFDKVEKQAKLSGNVMLQMLAKDFNRRNQDGLNLYKNISQILKSDKEASLFLLDAGIDGIKYPAESIAAGRTSDTARGFNYVVFDEDAISIEDVIKFQKDANKARGAVMVGMDGQAVIYALTNPNISTPLHELAHVYEHYLTGSEKETVLKSAGTKEWNTETSEYFARGFEKYLAEGKSPNEALSKVFEKFKQWLGDIYKAIKGSPIDVKLNKDMRKIYAQMLGAEEVKTEAKTEAKTEVKTEVKAETPSSTKGLPAFAEFDAISEDRAKMKEAKAAFIEKHGQLAYDAMKEISTNFTKITKALQEKEILTKKC